MPDRKTYIMFYVALSAIFSSFVLTACITGYDPCANPITAKTNMSCMSADEINKELNREDTY